MKKGVQRARFLALILALSISMLALSGCFDGRRRVTAENDPLMGVVTGTLTFVLGEEEYKVTFSSDSQEALAAPDATSQEGEFAGWSTKMGGEVVISAGEPIYYGTIAGLIVNSHVTLYPIYRTPLPDVSSNIQLYQYDTPSYLPRIDINTENSIALDDPSLISETEKRGGGGKLPAYYYTNATISVTNTETQYLLNDVEGRVRIRGNYSSLYPKRPLRIEFDEGQAMLGLNDGAKMQSWVLLAEWKDPSLLLNSVALYIGNALLESDGYYASGFRYVRVYVNGWYNGLYLLVEEPQVNENRVALPQPENPDNYEDLEGLTPEESEAIYGTHIGYLLEYDGYYYNEAALAHFSMDYGFLRHLDGTAFSPSSGQRSTPGISIRSAVYSQEQHDFIRQALQTVWNVVYDAVYNPHTAATEPYHTMNAEGEYIEAPWITSAYDAVASVIDVQSLVDMYILSEVAQDYDIGFCSFYFALDMSETGNHLLTFIAPWDFDYSLGNSTSDGGGVSATLGQPADPEQLIAEGKLVQESGQYAFVAGAALYPSDFTFTNADTLYAANTNNPWLVICTNQNWFWQQVNQRWREALSARVFTGAADLIDTYASLYVEDYAVNYGRWNILGQKIDSAQPDIVTYFRTQAHAAAYLKAWLQARVDGLTTAFAALAE